MSYLALKDTGETEMGMIRIELQGSFLDPSAGLQQSGKSISAMQHGHADAVARAIEYLTSEVLPRAIRLDHELHEQGHKPEGPFGHDVE